jgi:electron transfer flavoprotein alpha subunit
MPDVSPALLVLGRCDLRGAPDDATAALFAVASQLGCRADEPLGAALIPEPGTPRNVSPHVPKGSQAFLLWSTADDCSEEALAVCVAKLAESCSATLVLLSDNAWSREVAGRLAGLLGAPCAIGCRGLSRSEGTLRFQRELYGGAVSGEFVAHCDRLVATVVTSSVSAHGLELEPVMAEALEGAGPPSRPAMRVLERSKPEAPEASLERAKRIVSGGRGIGGPEGFEKLADLARRIDAQVGASRPPCDVRWVDASRMVGITGRTVTPELYLAVGISGSAQHRSGMADAETVVAINSDETADIFRFADYGVVGDWQEVVAGMLEALAAPSPEG